MKKVVKDIKNLVSLNRLYIDYNYFTNLPTEISELTSLSSININYQYYYDCRQQR